MLLQIQWIKRRDETLKRKFCFIFILFLLICIGLPFVIELMYIIGKTHPIIYTNYSQSDMLGYVASAIGLSVSVLAIMLSIQSNEVDIKITHAVTMSEKGNEALLIEICNYSEFDCKINSVEIYNKKERVSAHIIKSPPFEVKEKSSSEFIVEVETIKQILSQIDKQERKNIKYCINLVGHKRLYLSPKDLYKYLDIIDAHNEKILNGEIKTDQ